MELMMTWDDDMEWWVYSRGWDDNPGVCCMPP
jgi:hypothetical protein